MRLSGGGAPLKASHSKGLRRVSKRIAFTLTEVLLAVLIVGIIATIVLPAIITKYQDKVLDSAYKREIHSIQDSIDALAAVENKDSFYETTLATDAEAYMKKYLRVSKYCENGKDCFGKYYSKYTDNEKKTYTPSYDGSCAILKNGTSLCLNVSGGNVDMLIDVNGPKGPNVFGRDLRTYSYSAKGKTGYNMSSSGIIAINQDPIKDNGTDDPCSGMTCGCGTLPECKPVCKSSDTTLNCCKERTISDRSDPCCKYSYYDSNTTCHPCPIVSGIEGIKVPNVGCVYVIESYPPIKWGSADMQKWDPKWHNDRDNYWAGAKKACNDIGMSLATKSMLVQIYSYAYYALDNEYKDTYLMHVANTLNIFYGEYWALEEANSVQAYHVGFGSMDRGEVQVAYKNFNPTGDAAMCIGN